MSQGVIEFGTATLSYFASDNPINEAIDLAGLAPDVKTARAVTEAFEPVYAKLVVLQCRDQEPGRHQGQEGTHQQPHHGRIR
ncbi:hypothetical protein G6F35_018555 [Rhizopus arrhizus]|nr:hypothetical protein G6F35_018555 [Rhizopus arrhizus]